MITKPFWAVQSTFQPHGENLDGMFTQLAPALLYAAKIAVMFDGTAPDQTGKRSIIDEIQHLQAGLNVGNSADWSFVTDDLKIHGVRLSVCCPGVPPIGTKLKPGVNYPGITTVDWSAAGHSVTAAALMADVAMDQEALPATQPWLFRRNEDISASPKTYEVANNQERLHLVVETLGRKHKILSSLYCFPPEPASYLFKVYYGLPMWLTSWSIV